MKLHHVAKSLGVFAALNILTLGATSQNQPDTVPKNAGGISIQQPAVPDTSWKDLNSALIDHTRRLAEEEREFRASLNQQDEWRRKFWEDWYDKLWKCLAAVGVFLLGLLAWVNIRSKKDIDRLIQKQFAGRIEAAIAEKVSEFQKIGKDLEAGSRNLADKVKDRIDALEKLASAVSFSVVILNFDPQKRAITYLTQHGSCVILRA